MINYTRALSHQVLLGFSAVALIVVAFLQLIAGATALAHGNEKHDKSKKETVSASEARHDTAQAQHQHTQGQTVTPEKHGANAHNPASARASLSDFPNLHPLIVHFPIVLLLIVAAVAIGNILFLRKELDWIITIATLIGFGTAYYATRFAHPHTAGLTEHAQLVLDQHDLYADWTIYLSGAGLVAQLLSQFLFKSRRWSVLIVATILSGAAYAVAMAGHYGTQLVHIEGVGPQGQYLETEHHH